MVAGDDRPGHVAVRVRLAIALLAVLSLAACVVPPLLQQRGYTVQRGDTLYSIAWRYHVDWHQLASWNHIQPPYQISAGQKLVLAPGAATAATRRPAAPAPAASPAPSRTAQTTPADRPMPPEHKSVVVGGWQWPCSGPILHNYRESRPRHGLDIGGKLGQPIVAAAAGRVVYSGSGLPGYGNLIIIKHNQHYLSAYGFNRKLLVKQGDRVAAGQEIAEMGYGPGNVPMLHFEIRHDGQPVDPARVLPAR